MLDKIKIIYSRELTELMILAPQKWKLKRKLIKIKIKILIIESYFPEVLKDAIQGTLSTVVPAPPIIRPSKISVPFPGIAENH